MLAFGVEHGNEAKRQNMKVGGSASNAEFVEHFRRLRCAGIHSKAYSILGGPRETAETSAETTTFTIEPGVSLAYFAIYKEFIPALKFLRSKQTKGSDAHQRYSAYEQLDVAWDAVLDTALTDPGSAPFQELVEQIASAEAPLDPAELIAVYDELSRLGFRFFDSSNTAASTLISRPPLKY